jgi:hypothetical protein
MHTDGASIRGVSYPDRCHLITIWQCSADSHGQQRVRRSCVLKRTAPYDISRCPPPSARARLESARGVQNRLAAWVGPAWRRVCAIASPAASFSPAALDGGPRLANRHLRRPNSKVPFRSTIRCPDLRERQATDESKAGLGTTGIESRAHQRGADHTHRETAQGNLRIAHETDEADAM